MSRVIGHDRDPSTFNLRIYHRTTSSPRHRKRPVPPRPPQQPHLPLRRTLHAQLWFSMHSSAEYQIAIVGGRITGLTLALTCEQLDFYTMLERMVRSLAMGANQTIESSAVLINDWVIQQHPHYDSALPVDVIERALESYARQRQQRVGEIIYHAGMDYRWPLPCRLSETAKLQQVQGYKEADWIARGYMTVMHAPVIQPLFLTARGQLCEERLGRFKLKQQDRSSKLT
ncbi:hypothetical protein BDV12DRAFT_200404 [Aspergillus spectabilis]